MDINVSQVNADSQTLAEVEDNPKEDEPIDDTRIDELIPQDPSNSAFKDLITKGLLICTLHPALI